MKGSFSQSRLWMGDGFGAGRGIRVSLRNRVRIRLVLSVLDAFEGLTSLGMSLEVHQLGEFEVLERLGQGGMGAVYKARQSVLKRLVAIKTLSPALAMDGEFVTRFHNEAVAAAALNHPNLVQVYAAGENAGQHWFAMEFVDGESVQKRLDRLGKLEPEEAIAICMHVATALDFGWRKAQLIHRDIKPDNIFLSNDGEVKLGDLGLAKSASQENSLTMTGASMGTPLYISPEQTEGRRDIDLRSDIYSLGCTLFHLICGSPPYSGESAVGVMIKHVSAPLPDICAAYSYVHPAIAAVALKMMQKAPSDRYQSYSELTADLHAAFAALSAPVVQRRRKRFSWPSKSLRRRKDRLSN
jgi:serine/threonine-protein kinase